MKSFLIQDIRIFMQQLLIGETFDSFSVAKAELRTWCTFIVDGEIPEVFRQESSPAGETPGTFRQEGSPAGEDVQHAYVPWSRLRPHFLELIRGKEKPLSLRLVFRLADRNIPVFLRSAGLTFGPDDINGLFLNVNYSHGEGQEQITCVTGLSLKMFTLDKSAEHAWDEMCEKLLRRAGIPFT